MSPRLTLASLAAEIAALNARIAVLERANSGLARGRAVALRRAKRRGERTRALVAEKAAADVAAGRPERGRAKRIAIDLHLSERQVARILAALFSVSHLSASNGTDRSGHVVVEVAMRTEITLEITDGVWAKGKILNPGERYTTTAMDAYDLIASGKANFADARSELAFISGVKEANLQMAKRGGFARFSGSPYET